MEHILLTHGDLQFSAVTRGSGPLVLFLHGFPDNYHTWDSQLVALSDAGYRAVSVAMRGYQPDSQPVDGDYSQAAMAEDILHLVTELAGSGEPVHLVGHDWGAAIACAAAAAQPEMFSTLTLISVPHSGRFLTEIHRYPAQLVRSWYMLFFQLRGLADFIAGCRNGAFLRWLWRSWSPGWPVCEQHWRSVAGTFAKPGVLASTLAYYRSALSPRSLPLTAAKRRDARFKVAVPTLGLSGESDRCIGADVFEKMMYSDDFPNGLLVERVPAAGHFPQLEQAQWLNRRLIEWISNKR